MDTIYMYLLWELMRPYWWIAVHYKSQGIGIRNSFTTSYFGKALMYTLITQRGEVSGLVRILHQRLGYHMTKVTYIFHCGYILPVYTYTYRHTINQLIPPLYWFSIAHITSSPLHVLLSSNLDTGDEGGHSLGVV